MKKIKIYFEYKGVKVQDSEFDEFEEFEVSGTNYVFNNLSTAILYCIGVAEGKSKGMQLMAYVNTFITMINHND